MYIFLCIFYSAAFLRENKAWHSMWISCLADVSHEMSSFKMLYTNKCATQSDWSLITVSISSVCWLQKGLIRLREHHLLASRGSSFRDHSAYSISEVTNKPAHPQMRSNCLHLLLCIGQKQTARMSIFLSVVCSLFPKAIFLTFMLLHCSWY